MGDWLLLLLLWCGWAASYALTVLTIVEICVVGGGEEVW